MSNGMVFIDQDRCKGCTLCVAFCPQACLSMADDRLNVKGYHPAQLSEDTCTGCGVCAVICPDACITVYREPARRASKPAVVEG